MTKNAAIWTEHPNAQVIRDFFAHFATADETILRQFVQEEIVWHFPGVSPIAGDWHGIAGITQGIRALGFALRQEGQGDFELQEVAANDAVALSVHRDYYDGPDNQLNMRYILYARMVDGRIAEVWEIPFDLYENDRFQGKQAERLLQRQVTGS